jgi:hypothetical protein
MLERLRAISNLTIVEDAAQDLVLVGEAHAEDARVAAAAASAGMAGSDSGGAGAFRVSNKPSGHAESARAPEVAGVVTGGGAVIRARKVKCKVHSESTCSCTLQTALRCPRAPCCCDVDAGRFVNRDVSSRGHSHWAAAIPCW